MRHFQEYVPFLAGYRNDADAHEFVNHIFGSNRIFL